MNLPIRNAIKPRWIIPFLCFSGWLCLVTGSIQAQTDIPEAAPLSRDEQWRQDVQLLRQELPKRHLNLFFHLKKDEFEKRLAELDIQIPKLNDHEITVELMRAVAAVHDSHTSLNFPPRRVYPLGASWFQDGLFVAAIAPEYKQHLGARVVKIGNTSLEQAYEKICTVFASETPGWARVKSQLILNSPEILHGLRLLPDAETGTFTLEDKTGKQTVVNLPSIPVEKLKWEYLLDPAQPTTPLYLRKSDQNYWFEYLPESKTFFIKYNRCRETPELPFATFNQQVWDFIASHPVEKLVFDLRHNSGGNSAIMQPFFEALQKHGNLNRKGHLFVIIGGRTFSSGSMNAFQFREWTKAILVGQPTGMGTNHYGETKDFKLPHSALNVTYSTRFFKQTKEDITFIQPEILVQPTSTEVFSGHDPVLEAILKYGTR
ncbi:MAG: hypothetical protein K1Y36_06060 [Blastocatellia bacterium]|nr:hypothetical protein [Blastocatellia bacterium]